LTELLEQAVDALPRADMQNDIGRFVLESVAELVLRICISGCRIPRAFTLCRSGTWVDRVSFRQR
jgi:hypothetical protein